MSDRPKRAAIYARVSTFDQHPETQLLDLRQMAAQRGYEIVGECSDTISGAKQRGPGFDRLMADARRGQFEVVLVAAFDRVARAGRKPISPAARKRLSAVMKARWAARKKAT